MSTGRFEWLDVRTECREVRATDHGEEVRCLVNRETIRDRVSGQVQTRIILRQPGMTVLVPFLDDDRVILVRQYRHAVDRELWELPAGTIDARQQDARLAPAETAETCAARELIEETGYSAATLEKLGECYAMPGDSDDVIHVFAARGLVACPRKPDPGEVIEEVRAFTTAELAAMIARGDIRDAKTLVALLYALAGRPDGLTLP
jgi:ADP-ribose pyrophosphatase